MTFSKIVCALVLVLALPATAAKAAPAKGGGSGAYSEEGWIIRRTKKGVVKTPRKQKFRFEGSDVQGNVDRPSQGVLGARVPRKNTSLIPVRSSFREEFLSVSGLTDK
ncbi:MAG: hypothetical protein ABIR96_01510 [Bdellovibrionota bacterium]